MSFKNIPGFNGDYKINKNGVVRNKNNMILKSFINSGGYERISLIKNGDKRNFYIHRLICLTFLKNPYNLKEINHKNHNRLDNRLENLEFCTRSYNNYNKVKKQKH